VRFTEIANKLLAPLGFKIVRNSDAGARPQRDALYYQHNYGSGGYDEYRRVQIEANKLKLDKVWAEQETLESIAQYVEGSIPDHRRGLCHGARNGWEVRWFRDRLKCDVIGTDISETANDIDGMIQHDFHDVRDEWVGQFSFIYTNSLDQAFDPAKALSAWAGQLTDGGLIFIEHTMHHSPSGASKMDPFGAHPLIMPYMFFDWGRGQYELVNILKFHDRKMGEHGVIASKGDVWVFVLKKARICEAAGIGFAAHGSA
jgi:hypothetical protein